MTDTFTRAAIAERISDTADELLDEYENDLDEARDHVAEAVDGMDWVIYHYKAQRVFEALRLSEQGEAFDRMKEYGGLDDIDHLGTLYSRLTYCALESLLTEVLGLEHQRREDEADDEDDADDDC